MRSGWDYLLVLEILLQGNAARHDGCELDVVHKICAGVFGQVFFDDLASKKANPSDKASDGRGVEYRLHELVVRHGEVYLGVLVLLFRNHNSCSDRGRRSSRRFYSRRRCRCVSREHIRFRGVEV